MTIQFVSIHMQIYINIFNYFGVWKQFYIFVTTNTQEL